MNTSALRTAMKESYACAMAMLETGTYIERELPTVQMDERVRVKVSELCSELIGTKHDVVHELAELDELLTNGVTGEQVTSALGRIIRWLWDDIHQMHDIVTLLRAAADSDPAYSLGFILVSESAVSILGPFTRAKEAADSVTSG
jgi:hypothetical protein